MAGKQDKNKIGTGQKTFYQKYSHPVPIVPAVGGSCSYPVTPVGEIERDGLKLHLVSALKTEKSQDTPFISKNEIDLNRIGTRWEQDRKRYIRNIPILFLS